MPIEEDAAVICVFTVNASTLAIIPMDLRDRKLLFILLGIGREVSKRNDLSLAFAS